MVGNSARIEANVPQPEWLSGFTEAVGHIAEDPNRPISAPWARHVLDYRLNNHHYLDLLERFHALNPGATPSEAQRRFLSAEQAALLAAQQDGRLPFAPYPSERYTDVQQWAQVYKWLRTDQSGYGNQYFANVVKRPLMTSVSQREVAARIVRRFLSHLMSDEPLWASCGCFDMAGDRRNWLANRDPAFRFDQVAVRSKAPDGRPTISEYKSDLLNQVILEEDTTRRVVGLDQVNPNEPANMAWSHACAMPEEIWAGTRDELHDRILRAHVPTEYLAFCLADLASRKSMQSVVKEHGTFDGAYASFSWHQGSAEMRRRKLINMSDKLVGQRGLLVIADFARVVGKRFLSPEDQWRKPTVFVGYQGELYPVLRADSGRFQAIKVLPALAELAQGGPHEKTVQELLA